MKFLIREGISEIKGQGINVTTAGVTGVTRDACLGSK